jgi:diguanylate cyclase (GGDEF)-like protein
MRDPRAGPDEPLHVLLVERDRAAASLISEMLRMSWNGGLSLTYAERIEDATQHLLGGAVSAVLLSGRETLAALAGTRPVAPTVPIIVLASHYSDAAAVEAIRAGAQDYLSRNHLTASELRRVLIKAVERKRPEAVLARRALQDPLTGLPNRTLFVDRLGVALERSRRTGSVTCVLFLDVDHFKLINDSRGHAAGDQVLSDLAARLRSVLRPMDTVARFGGDEFTFLFEDLSSESEAMAIADRVRRAASLPVELEGGQQELNVSIGVATASEPGSSPDALIREADAAMYRAKARGGGAAALLGEPPPETPEEQNVLTAQLRQALERAELRVVYQPQYGLQDDERVAGFEALVRWQHPDRGLIAPREFIPLAEENGLVGPIGRFVLREALTLLARLRIARPDLTMSVNLSLQQLGEVEVAAALAAVDEAGVDPAAVCLEIPEGLLSRDPERTLQAVQSLRAAGLRIAIDDYGTGSASLQSLRRLEAHELKIHESFVGELDGSPRDGKAVSAAVELGHALGMEVVAEGVETDAQLLELRSLGCDGAQGYLLGRPVAEDQLEALIGT